MATTTLEPTPVSSDTDSNPDHFAHYVKKDKITDALVYGQEVEALCGYRWVPYRDPASLPICPPCKEIFDALPE
jgi:hypothetical protein